MSKEVLVVVGTGGMGVSAVNRLGAGRSILLADFSEKALTENAERLTGNGHEVTTFTVDVSKRESVAALAAKAASLGTVTTVIHTAGISPTMGTTEAILRVDYLGTALVLEEFGTIIAPGGAGIVISSMSAYMVPPLSPEVAHQVANAPTDELLDVPAAAPANFEHPGLAYAFAKQANQLRVAAAGKAWGGRGARINSISPGVISTPLGQQELASESGAQMRGMIQMSGTGRIGTPEDIANAIEFLVGPNATFITATDLLVDGGVVGAIKAR